MRTADVAIVGAGIVGAACAAELARSGLKVAIIEHRGIASGTTAAGMGHLVAMDDSEAQFALCRRSRELWQQLSKQLPGNAEYENCGTIWVAADAEEMSEVERKLGFYLERGSSAEILDEKAIREAEPNLRHGLAGGLLVESDSVVYQPVATEFLIREAEVNGAEVIRAAATRLVSDGVELADGGRVTADTIVNATGSDAPRLSPQLNIVRRKGHLAITERYPGFVSHQLIELGYLRSAHGKDADSVAFNVQPRSTGQVLVGSTRQFGKDSDEIDHAILKRMCERAFEYMPGLRNLFVSRTWTGHRPSTPDNLPYIGPIAEQKSVIAAAGHEGLGITTSLGTAELVADHILGRRSTIDPTPYLPGRFAAAA